MKTGTLTFHGANNNGSFLQAYALQQILLNKLNVDNEIINFYSERQEQQYSLLRTPHSASDIARNLISIIHWKDISLKNKRFSEMRDQFLKMTERFKTDEQAYQCLSNYDVIICGSDQIWNTEARDFSDIYLLDNFTNKKVSYAVSCGSHLEEIDKQKVIRSAKRFNSLSVRESALHQLFSDEGVKVKRVLDPTLLLEKEDYTKLFNNQPYIKGDYILLYTINFDDEVLKSVQQLAATKNLKVYTPFTGYSAIKCRKFGIKVLYDVGPAQFLNLFNNATYICSNSFHGVVFSIIFNKPFYRICSTDKDGNNLTDDRIDGLLNALKLTSVNVNQYNVLNKNVKWNYDQSSKLLKSMRDDSISFLIDSLSVN